MVWLVESTLVASFVAAVIANFAVGCRRAWRAQTPLGRASTGGDVRVAVFGSLGVSSGNVPHFLLTVFSHGVKVEDQVPLLARSPFARGVGEPPRFTTRRRLGMLHIKDETSRAWFASWSEAHLLEAVGALDRRGWLGDGASSGVPS